MVNKWCFVNTFNEVRLSVNCLFDGIKRYLYLRKRLRNILWLCKDLRKYFNCFEIQYLGVNILHIGLG